MDFVLPAPAGVSPAPSDGQDARLSLDPPVWWGVGVWGIH